MCEGVLVDSINKWMDKQLPHYYTKAEQEREWYKNIMGDMKAQFTSQDVPKPFKPQGGLPGGDLPAGEVDMTQIMGLMNTK